MRTLFLRFSWGMLLFMLDFRIQSFDVLPDMVGYLMMWSALSGLREYWSRYSRAMPYALALALLSLVDIIPILGGPPGDTEVSLPWLVWSSAAALLHLVFFYRFLVELERHAAELCAVTLADTVRGRRIFFAAATGLLLLLIPFTMNESNQPIAILLVAMSLLAFIAELLIFFVCRRAAKELDYHTDG